MDKHKQFTNNVHPIGATIDPEDATKKKPELSDADLTSDFTSDIDPNTPAPDPLPVKEPEVVPAPPLLDDDKKAAPTVAAEVSAPNRFQRLWANKPLRIAGLVGGLIILVGTGALIGRYYLKPHAQTLTSTNGIDQNTVYIDSSKHSVGIAAGTNPDGLQVGTKVSATPQGSANIRLGLVNGTDPSVLFEDGQKNVWQMVGVGGSMQLIQGGQVRAKLDNSALTLANSLNVNGNTTLGSSGDSTLTIQGSSVAIPNNLNFSNNTFVIESSKGTVAVGASTASGYKLLVAGTLKANGNITTDGQVLATPGSAKGPGLTFNNNSNTGIYEPTLNAVGVAAGGTQVLQVQQGTVYTVNGANIEADGYLRAGRGSNSPFFQALRFTGTLDGSGTASVTDGLSTGYNHVLVIQAFYRGNSNEAIPLNVDYVNSGNFVISGGVAGRQYRATVFYSSDGAGW